MYVPAAGAVEVGAAGGRRPRRSGSLPQQRRRIVSRYWLAHSAQRPQLGKLPTWYRPRIRPGDQFRVRQTSPGDGFQHRRVLSTRPVESRPRIGRGRNGTRPHQLARPSSADSPSRTAARRMTVQAVATTREIGSFPAAPNYVPQPVVQAAEVDHMVRPALAGMVEHHIDNSSLPCRASASRRNCPRNQGSPSTSTGLRRENASGS